MPAYAMPNPVDTAAEGTQGRPAAPSAPERPDQRLPKAARVLKRGEFLRLQRVGERRGGKCFVVLGCRSRGPLSRLGVTASRKAGNSVARNRVKRRVREFFRRHRHAIFPPRDIVVIVRAAAADASSAEIGAELARALQIEVRA